MHDNAESVQLVKNKGDVLISEVMHVSRVTNRYLFIVELKLDNLSQIDSHKLRHI